MKYMMFVATDAEPDTDHVSRGEGRVRPGKQLTGMDERVKVFGGELPAGADVAAIHHRARVPTGSPNPAMR